MTYLSEILAHTLTDQEQDKTHLLARKLISRILIPTHLTSQVLRKYIRKAIQNKSWYRLSQLQRALLYAASKTVNRVRSPTLHRLLEEILVEIELAGTKAQALYYGVILLLKQSPNILQTLLTKTKQLLGKLLYLGISYLNNPPTVSYTHLTLPTKA